MPPVTGGPLPAPWLSTTLGTGTGNSSYTADTGTFALSAAGVGNAPTTHYVYQSVLGDATLIARVQNLETIDQSARAGLMIRQDTSPEAAYAFLALTPQGVRLESRQGGSTGVAHVEGSGAGAPVWLKLERKEGSVYAYESGDGVNWRLIGSAVLALNAPINFGLAAATPSGTAAATFTNVQAQATDLSQGDVVVEEILSNDDRSIAYDLYKSSTGRMMSEGNAGVTFDENVLTYATNVKFTISKVPAKNYPTDDYFARNYPAERVRHLGPLVTTEVPMNALDWQGVEEKPLLLISPSFYEGALETAETRNIFMEVRILRPDGELVFYTFDYGFFGEVLISNIFLQTNLLGSVPERLEISVQAVDLSGVLPDPGALPGTMPEQQNSRGGLEQVQVPSLGRLVYARSDRPDGLKVAATAPRSTSRGSVSFRRSFR